MKKMVLIYLISIAMILTTTKSVTQGSATTLPTMIQEPLFKEGWLLLNQHTEPVRLWDGRTVSGYELAQFALNHAIAIVWDTDNLCDGGSCSIRCSQADGCPIFDGKTSAQVIYLRLSLMAKSDHPLAELVDALAHEIYHLTLPYGPVDNTLYEEFSAYFVGEHIAMDQIVNFDNYNPLRPACLVKWFHDTQLLQGYRDFHAYPPAVLPLVDTSSATCPQAAETTPATGPEIPLKCLLNADGSVNYIYLPPIGPTPAPETRTECRDYPDGTYGCQLIWLTQAPTQGTPDISTK